MISSNFSEEIRQVLLPETDCQYATTEKSHALRPAAVLIALVNTDEGLSIILTTRTQHLHNHAGQISLPGGMRDKSDSSPIATALRETDEEIGITADYIDVIGSLDHYQSPTGFIITPVIGQVKAGYSLQADPFEVDEIFMVPLTFLFDEKNQQKHIYAAPHKKGREKSRSYYQFDYGEKRIWGITAAILVNFYKRLRDNHPLFCELVPQIRSQ